MDKSPVRAWFSSLLLVVMLTAALAACNASTPPPTSTPAPQGSTGSLSFMVFGDPAELKAYQTLVEAFVRQNPGIHVELIHIPSQSDYRKRLGADFAAGTPADVVLINYRRYAPFAAKGALEPLDSYLDQSQVIQRSDFYTEAIQAFRWNGQLMCIPQNMSSLVVYYNKKLFQQAGLPEPSAAWTWEDFLQTAQALTRDTDNDGKTDQFGLGTEVSLFRVAPFIWQNGGELANAPVSPTQLMLDTPEATEAIQWFVDLQVKYHLTPNAEEEAAEDSESRFMNGTVGMYFNSRRTTPTFREITAFEWDVAPLPQHKHIASILHADGYCMPSTVKDKALVWKFIEFANSPTGQEIVAETGRTVPSLKAVAESPAFLDPDASPRNSRVFLDAIPYLRAVPISAAWVDIEEAVGEELKRAFYGQASVAEVIQAALERSQIYLVEEP